jgi:hypothetical protein
MDSCILTSGETAGQVPYHLTGSSRDPPYPSASANRPARPFPTSTAWPATSQDVEILDGPIRDQDETAGQFSTAKVV